MYIISIKKLKTHALNVRVTYWYADLNYPINFLSESLRDLQPQLSYALPRLRW